MSEPTKIRPKKKKLASIVRKPDDLVVDILDMKDLGTIIARAKELPSGTYDLVIEFKMGKASMKDPDGTSFPSIAVAVGGIGLRVSDKPGPHTITIP